jgi:SAM-dependent methyltransferase
MIDTQHTMKHRRTRPSRHLLGLAIALTAATASCPAAPVAGKRETPAAFGFRVKDLASLTRRFTEFSNDLPSGKELGVEKILAFEENPHFAYVRGTSTAGDRRIIFRRPATFIVLDISSGGDRAWVLSGSAPAKTTGNSFSVTEDDVSVTGQALVTNAPAFTPAERFVHVLHVGNGASSQVTATEANGTVRLELTTGERVCRITLPLDPTLPGKIAVEQGDKTLLANRLLPASIMPHGDKGVEMMERWDSSYRRTRMPGWDVGRPASELQEIVENGTINPGKALVLGCGTGTNAVYLASKGFEVTGVDVAPTALVLAEERAAKANVRVRWLVADVVTLPDIGSFDFIFDRGCYHHVQLYNAAGFVKSMDSRTTPGAHFLLLAGNANEPNHGGPPRVEETQLVDNFARTWDFVSLKEIRFESRDPNRKTGPWAWSALMRRQAPNE